MRKKKSLRKDLYVRERKNIYIGRIYMYEGRKSKRKRNREASYVRS